MKSILFHGPSGCGKDTQVDLLVEKYGFENIGTGDMFRNMYKLGMKTLLRLINTGVRSVGT